MHQNNEKNIEFFLEISFTVVTFFLHVCIMDHRWRVTLIQ